jgi:trk system potassium uptake protein
MKPKKRICVIGLGGFGGELARALAKDCELLAIDRNESTINEISEDVHRALCFDARDYASLSSVVTRELDEVVVCMGASLEASILCTLHLRRIGVERIRVRALSNDHASILMAVGATEVVFPERETALRLAQQIQNSNLLDFIPLSDDYMVMQVASPESFCGKTLAQADVRGRFGLFVIAVKEHVPERTVFLPGPDFVIKPSDSLVIIGKDEGLKALQHVDSEKKA